MSSIRRLEAADAPRFRALRLLALREYPRFYTATYAEESAAPETYHAAMLENHLAYGAFDGEMLIGSAIAQRQPMLRLRHKCILSAVFVRSDYQGCGIGRHLLETLLDAASEEFEQALIAVDTANATGIHLYESLGFIGFGMEKKALKDGENYLDDLWLKKDFGKSPPPAA